MRIYIKGEFVRISKKEEGISGKIGQIYKVENLESDFPYVVITVLDNKETFFFMANQTELKYCEYKQIEMEDELIFYMKNVKR